MVNLFSCLGCEWSSSYVEQFDKMAQFSWDFDPVAHISFCSTKQDTFDWQVDKISQLELSCFIDSQKKNIGKFCRRPLHLIPSTPRSWSWLASTDQKVWADRPGLIGRFSLFINKNEVCNAYTELNKRLHGVAAAILRVCQAFSGSVMIKWWQWTRRSALQLIEYGLWELGFWD